MEGLGGNRSSSELCMMYVMDWYFFELGPVAMSSPRPRTAQLQCGSCNARVVPMVASATGLCVRAPTCKQSQCDAWRLSPSLPLQYFPFEMKVHFGNK